MPVSQIGKDPISFMISDTDFAMEVQLVDPKSSYATKGPYRAVEGKVRRRALMSPNTNIGAVVSSTADINPDQFELSFKSSEYFGSAFSAVDYGQK